MFGKASPVLLISALCLVIYSNSLGTSLHYDDFFAITGNAAVRDVTNAGEIFRLFPSRFLLMYSFAVNYYFHQADPVGYHVMNLVIHMMNALLLYSISRILWRASRPESDVENGVAYSPLLVALLFAAHPVMTESVTYIAGRASSLGAAFFLAALLLYLLLLKAHSGSFVTRTVFYGSSLFMFFLSLWVKESNATLPAIVLMADLYFHEQGRWKDVKHSLLRAAPFFLVLAAILLWRKLYLGVIGDPFEVRALSVNLLTQLRVIFVYLRLIFLPVGQNIDHHIQLSHSLFELKTFLSLAGLLALILISIMLSRRNRLVSFGILWFLITLSPTSVIPLWDIMSERWIYLPAAGIFLAVVACLPPLHNLLLRRAGRDRLLPAAIAILVLLLGGATILRNTVWRNEYTLWKDAAEKSPAKARPHINLGMAFAEKGDMPEAVSELNAALAMDPASPEANFSLSALYLKMGNYDDAVKILAPTLARFPESSQIPVRLADDFAKARFNLGVGYFYKGHYERALAEYREALRLAPYMPWVHSNVGVIHEMRGEYELAIAEYEKELELHPDLPQVAGNIGNARRKMQRKAASSPKSHTDNH